MVGNTNLEVTWDVAGTDGNGVDCSSVDIFLSTDGGYTFPTLLVAGTPNDGSATVVLPNVSTGQARIKVKGSNHVFFDISNNNFILEACTDDDDGDGVCNQLEVTGCQDVTACNYNEAATDPGACFYPDEGYNCDGSPLCLEDLNANGAIDVGDVLLVLSEFGCQSDCTADVTGDGLVVVDDILVVLAVFGVVCQ